MGGEDLGHQGEGEEDVEVDLYFERDNGDIPESPPAQGAWIEKSGNK